MIDHIEFWGTTGHQTLTGPLYTHRSRYHGEIPHRNRPLDNSLILPVTTDRTGNRFILGATEVHGGPAGCEKHGIKLILGYLVAQQVFQRKS